MNELYKRIEALCEKKGITITAMCKEANVNRGNLSDLKTGRQSGLSKKNLEKIAAYLEVTPAYLMGWAREPDDMDKAVLEKYPGLRLGYETIQEYLDRMEAEKKKDPEPSQPAKSEVSEEDIKFALFGGSGEITDEMYDEVKEFVKFVKMKHGQE